MRREKITSECIYLPDTNRLAELDIIAKIAGSYTPS